MEKIDGWLDGLKKIYGWLEGWIKKRYIWMVGRIKNNKKQMDGWKGNKK